MVEPMAMIPVAESYPEVGAVVATAAHGENYTAVEYCRLAADAVAGRTNLTTIGLPSDIGFDGVDHLTRGIHSYVESNDGEAPTASAVLEANDGTDGRPDLTQWLRSADDEAHKNERVTYLARVISGSVGEAVFVHNEPGIANVAPLHDNAGLDYQKPLRGLWGQIVSARTALGGSTTKGNYTTKSADEKGKQYMVNDEGEKREVLQQHRSGFGHVMVDGRHTLVRGKALEMAADALNKEYDYGPGTSGDLNITENLDGKGWEETLVKVLEE